MTKMLAHRLTMARHGQRLSQQMVAKQAGITQKHLSQIERGRVTFLSVSSGTIRRLARILGVTTDYLLGMECAEEEPET